MRQLHLAGPLSPRGQHHRWGQRVPDQGRGHRPRHTLESDQRQGSFIDPAAGKTTLADWSTDWLGALDVAIRTEDFYRSLLRRHILPRWGAHSLVDISGIKAAAWAKDLRNAGYSTVTVASVMKLLSLLLADAAVSGWGWWG